MIDKLMNFGLTRQEATVYLALCRLGSMGGYEVAKQTGISRSNAYCALAGLVDKGAAYVNNGATVKYTPLDVGEFCDNKLRGLEGDRNYLVEHVPTEKECNEGYLTISGDKHIRDKIISLFRQTEYRMYLSMKACMLAEFEQEIDALCKREIKIVIVTNCEVEQFSSKGIKVYLTELEENQIGLISDSKTVLTGELGLGEDSNCLYSEAQNFVRVFKGLLSNQIKYIEISGGNIKK